MASRVRTILEFVKIEHTLFALPFILAGYVVGLRHVGAPFALGTLALVLVAAVGARTLAMTLNRIVDRSIDGRNPRTATRALPAGTMTLSTAVTLAVVALVAMLSAAALLNRLVLLLSPVLVALFFAYPYAKRVTPLCHFVLGLAFLCAPAGGYLAVTGSFDGWFAPLALGLAAMTWVTGFDILYALLDVEFDRANDVHSLPADLGEGPSRRVAAGLHALAVLFLAIFAKVEGLGWPMYVGVIAIAALLVYEHATADPRDPVALNKAFFNVNAIVGWIALVGLVVALAV